MRGRDANITNISLPVDEDFDPNIHLDNVGLKTPVSSTTDVKLWAKMVFILYILLIYHLKCLIAHILMFTDLQSISIVSRSFPVEQRLSIVINGERKRRLTRTRT